MFIFAGGASGACLNQCFATWLPVYIGKLSYSIYFWHWPVFILFKWTVGFYSVKQRVAAVILVLGLSLMSFHGLETPVRTWRHGSNWIVFCILLPVLIFSETWLLTLQG